MDIATCGVAIDPTKSVEGSRRVRDELKQIGQTARTELGKVDAAADKAGISVKRTGEQAKDAGGNVRAGFLDMGRGIMDFLDGMGLLNNGFGEMLRRTDSAIRGGQQLATLHRANAAVASNTYSRAIDGLTNSLHSNSGASVGLLARLAPLGAVLGVVALALGAAVVAGAGLAGTFAAISASIPEAAKMEQFEIKLAVAMGSFDKARAKMGTLRQFAMETPFSDEEVFAAGSALEAQTKGALTNLEALKAIGGAAAQAGMSFQQMAESVGTIYQGLKYGGDVLEYIKTLASKGIIDGATLVGVRQLGEEAEKSGNKFANSGKQWAMIYEDLKKKSVALILQSRTWNGLISTLEGSWDALKAAFGKPIMDALKPVLVDLINAFPALIAMAEKFGNMIGNALKVVVQAFRDGELATVLALAIQVGAIQGAQMLLSAVAEVLPPVGDFLAYALKTAGLIFITWLIQNLISSFTESIKAVVSLAMMLVNGVVSGFAQLIRNLCGGAVADTTTKLEKGGGSAIEYIATAIYNQLGQAFEDVVNIFLGGLMNAVGQAASALATAASKFIPGAGAAIQAGATAAKALGLGPDGKSAPAGPVTVDIFTPKPQQKAGDVFGTGTPGTTAGDASTALQSKSAELLAKFNAENKPFSDKDLGGLKVNTGGATSASAGGGGKGSKEKEEPVLRAKEVESEMKRLTEAWSDLGAMMDSAMASAAQSVTGHMTDAITGMIMGTKDAKQAFAEMANGIISDIIRMIIQMTIQLAIAKALGPYAAAGGAFQTVAAGGFGIAESTGSAAPPPKFHSGGRASSETAATLDKDETVLTRRRSAELARELTAARESRQTTAKGQGGNSATIINVLDRNEIADAVARNPGAVVNAMSRNLPAVRKMVMTGNRA